MFVCVYLITYLKRLLLSRKQLALCCRCLVDRTFTNLNETVPDRLIVAF